MDPLTAALNLATTVAQIVKLVIESQPPEVRAEFARIHLEDLKHWREVIDKLVKRGSSAGPAVRTIRRKTASRSAARGAARRRGGSSGARRR